MDLKPVLVTGTSAAGKTRVVDGLLARGVGVRPVTATARPPRDNEVHGRDYFFYTEDEFARLVHPNMDAATLRALLEMGIPCTEIIAKHGVHQLIEFALVYDQLKGIPRNALAHTRAQGKRPLLILDVQGVAVVRADEGANNVITVAIVPPSLEFVRRNLLHRQPDIDPAELDTRLAMVEPEIREIHESGIYDHIVVNEDGYVEQTIDEIIRRIEPSNTLAG